ncbi:MAG: ribosomal protein S18-alanine N-acetyltransferase [Candidatus Bathyarchaeota archaeon]
MINEIRVREATSKDLETVYVIDKQSFKDPYPLAFIEFLYNADRKTFLVAEKDGMVVGYIIASPVKDLGHIIAIAINPSERRKNIGRTIMNAVLEILQSIGVTSVRLEVRLSNIEAQKFYETIGFDRSYTIDNYYGEEDALVYFKHF